MDNPQTQAEMNEESYRLLEESEKRLAAAYVAAVTALWSDRERELLYNAQLLWGLFVDQEVDLVGERYQGGSIRPLAMNMRRVKRNDERVADLKLMTEEGGI